MVPMRTKIPAAQRDTQSFHESPHRPVQVVKSDDHQELPRTVNFSWRP